MLINLIPPQYRAVAIVTGLLVLIVASFGAGWKVQGWRMGEDAAEWREAAANAVVDSVQEARRVERLSADLAEANGALFQARQAAERAEARVVTKEVIKYVQADYAGRCDLPVGWVRLDTASATGVPPDAVSLAGPDGAASGFTDADALAVIVERNHVCRAEIAKLSALQDFIRQQQEARTDGR